MTKVYTYSVPLEIDMVDAFCALQKGFTDQFVYYDKTRACRFMGLGRCIAVPSLSEVEYEVAGACLLPPSFFSFNRFDANNPQPTDDMFAAFPRLALMLPEVVLIENEQGVFLQVNSLGPVYAGRVERFLRQVSCAPHRVRVSVPFVLEPDSRQEWERAVGQALTAIEEGRVKKIVPSRRQFLRAVHPFSSKDLLINLIDGPARGTVLMYRYGDVFFCGCTPELLVRKAGNQVESMCLAGTCSAGTNEDERRLNAEKLLCDKKNLREHAHVVDFVREVFSRVCYDVDIPSSPCILSLQHIQHLYTSACARVLEGVTLDDLRTQLHPTPALCGAPVGESLMLLRRIETYNRGFFGGACGYVDGDGNGEYSVAIRSGVFDGETGWVYAGCGIVAGSVAQAEYDEIDMKLKTILTAFDGEEVGDVSR
ncbi:MAG: isochorismate synthase [Raoultibacter sp.]